MTAESASEKAIRLLGHPLSWALLGVGLWVVSLVWDVMSDPRTPVWIIFVGSVGVLCILRAWLMYRSQRKTRLPDEP